MVVVGGWVGGGGGQELRDTEEVGRRETSDGRSRGGAPPRSQVDDG
jgi:hypothetical protein